MGTIPQRKAEDTRARAGRTGLISTLIGSAALSGLGSSTVQNTYGVMDDAFQLVSTFKHFPPRSFPPSFNPANVMETAMDNCKRRKMRREGWTPSRCVPP